MPGFNFMQMIQLFAIVNQHSVRHLTYYNSLLIFPQAWFKRVPLLVVFFYTPLSYIFILSTYSYWTICFKLCKFKAVVNTIRDISVNLFAKCSAGTLLLSWFSQYCTTVFSFPQLNPLDSSFIWDYLLFTVKCFILFFWLQLNVLLRV